MRKQCIKTILDRLAYFFHDESLHDGIAWRQDGLLLHGIVVNLGHWNDLWILFPQVRRKQVFVDAGDRVGTQLVRAPINFADRTFLKMFRAESRVQGRLPLWVHQVVPDGQDPLLPLLWIPRERVSVANPSTRWDKTAFFFVHCNS